MCMCEDFQDLEKEFYELKYKVDEKIDTINHLEHKMNVLMQGVTDKNLVISKQLDDEQEERVRMLELTFKQLSLSIGALQERLTASDKMQTGLFKEIVDKIGIKEKSNKNLKKVKDSEAAFYGHMGFIVN